MYKSKEIRWFFQENDKTIALWFSVRGLEVSKTEPRTDFYLPIPGKEDMSVKLREGNVEIKLRHGQPVSHQLTKNAIGYLEDWVKWSFDVEGNDELSSSIIKRKKYDWIGVYKERIGIKLTKDVRGTRLETSLKDIVPFGCQIEYTRLVIEGKECFTFGLEWFGEKCLELDTNQIEEILGDCKLAAKDSMGYSGFLNRI